MGCIIDDSVYTGKLLDNLKHTSDNETTIEMAHEEELSVLVDCEFETGVYAGEASFGAFLFENAGCFYGEHFEADTGV